jgi:hypothetical protein
MDNTQKLTQNLHNFLELMSITHYCGFSPLDGVDFAIDFMQGDIYYMIVKIHLDDGFGIFLKKDSFRRDLVYLKLMKFYALNKHYDVESCFNLYIQ